MKQIAVGSTNPVKLDAIRHVVDRLWPQVQFLPIEVESGVRAQPLSDEEAIQGALNRARGALLQHPSDLGIGIEGNTVELAFGMFSTAWVAIVDRQGQVGLGSSGRFVLPETIAEAIRKGGELGPLMDQRTGESNVKQKQGAVGILTKGLLNRTEALEIGVICALSQFVASEYYRA
ncbi:MAG: inosine/xanthosine triphosphatase [Caldilineaceae bacterium]